MAKFPSKKTGDELVGARIAARRTALQLTREALASRIGASYALIAQIETGWRMPSHEKQRLLARELGVGLDELFGEVSDAPATPDGAVASAAFPLGELRVAAPVAGAAPVPASDLAPEETPKLGRPRGLRKRAAAEPAHVSDMVAMAAPPHPLEGVPMGSAAPAPVPSAKPSFEQAVESAVEQLRALPASRRLDALSRLQLIVLREVADDERRRVGSDARRTGWITDLAPDEVFVFGSNAEGRHGGGAARLAYERFGAVWGEGHGHHGQSYAIDTMSGPSVLRDEVARFLGYARRHPELRFLLTPIGTGAAGYRADEIASLFAGAPGNVVVPGEFLVE